MKHLRLFENFEKVNEGKKELSHKILDKILDTQPGRKFDVLNKHLDEIKFKEIKTRDEAYKVANSLCAGHQGLCKSIWKLICKENDLKEK